MSEESSQYTNFDHDAFARLRPDNDYWGQVRRTVDGAPVGEEQIAMIVSAVRDGLDLRQEDVVLDIACGNGALSSRLFGHCRELHGFDLSEFLISVAREVFQRLPNYSFSHGDAVAYLQADRSPERYSKALCYGSFAYLSEEEASAVLNVLSARYTNVSRVFIGNLPDLLLRHLFFTRTPVPSEAALKENTSAIGVWRSEEEFTELAWQAGWSTQVRRMPRDFFSAAYRYDVVLERNATNQ